MGLLGNLGDLKAFLGMPPAPSPLDYQLNLLLNMASTAIEQFCNRSFNQGNWTQILCGDGTPYLALRNRPVWTYVYQTTTTSGSAVVAVASTVGLVVGMPVVGIGPYTQTGVQPGSTILSIASGSVTLSQAVTVTTTQPLVFGLAIWENGQGNWGQAVGPYQPQTQLVVGTDYALQLDVPGGASSESGLVLSLDGCWDNQWQAWAGTITPTAVLGQGNLLVQYTGGYVQLPPDLNLACYLQAAYARQLAPLGRPMGSESYGDKAGSYSYSAPGENKWGFLSPAVMGIIAKYRNVAVG